MIQRLKVVRRLDHCMKTALGYRYRRGSARSLAIASTASFAITNTTGTSALFTALACTFATLGTKSPARLLAEGLEGNPF